MFDRFREFPREEAPAVADAGGEFLLFGLGIDDVLKAIPLFHRCLFGRRGGLVILVEQFFGEYGIEVGPGDGCWLLGYLVIGLLGDWAGERAEKNPRNERKSFSICAKNSPFIRLEKIRENPLNPWFQIHGPVDPSQPRKLQN